MKIRDSPVEEDRCGVCGGDGSKCKVRSREFNKRINKAGNTKIMLLPKGARNIHIILKSEVNYFISKCKIDSIVDISQVF